MKKIGIGVSILVIVSLISLNIVVPQELILEIHSEEQGLLEEKVDLTTEFTYYSIHSVSNTSLLEFIRIDQVDNELVFIADKVRYEDQSGAGLPEYNYDDSVFYEEDGYFYIDNINRVYETLSFRVNEQYENTLTINDKTYYLYEYFEKGKGSVTVTLKKKGLMKRLIDFF